MSNIAAVMKEMIRQQLMTLHTCLICKVLNVYANDTAKVHPLTMVQTATGEVRQHQALDCVPIADHVKNTIKVGSICIVVFAERDIAKSLSGEYALPSLARHHSLSDGLIVGTIGCETETPGTQWYAPLSAETNTAKTTVVDSETDAGKEIRVDVKLSSASDNLIRSTSDGLYAPGYTKDEIDTKIEGLQESSHTHKNKEILDEIEEPYTTAEKDKLAGLENYTAGTGLSMSGTTINHKNSVAAKTTAGFLKFKYDAQGHITGSSPVTKSDFFDYGIPYVTVGYDGEYAYCFDYDEYGIPVKKIPDLTKNVDLKNIVQSFTVDESYFEAQKIGGRYKFTYKLPKDYLDNGFTLKFVICGTLEKESMILELTESCGVFTTKISTFSADRDPFTWAEDPVFKVMYKISPDTINSDGERYLYLNISRLYLTYILSYQSIVGVCEFVNLDKDTLNYDESDMRESRIELLDRYYNATQSNPGLMSAKDKTKLDNIADSANNYVHPTTSGNKHIPSGGSSGKILRWSADGTAVWGDDKDTKYSNATQSA